MVLRWRKPLKMKRNYNKAQIRVIKVNMHRVLLDTSPQGEGVENTGQGEPGKPFDAKNDEDPFGW